MEQGDNVAKLKIMSARSMHEAVTALTSYARSGCWQW
jgi:hypothetical protein